MSTNRFKQCFKTDFPDFPLQQLSFCGSHARVFCPTALIFSARKFTNFKNLKYCQSVTIVLRLPTIRFFRFFLHEVSLILMSEKILHIMVDNNEVQLILVVIAQTKYILTQKVPIQSCLQIHFLVLRSLWYMTAISQFLLLSTILLEGSLLACLFLSQLWQHFRWRT